MSRSSRPTLLALLALVAIAAAVNLGVGFLCALRIDVNTLERRESSSAPADVHEFWRDRRPPWFPDLPADHRYSDHAALGFYMRYLQVGTPDASYSVAWIDAGWPIAVWRGARWRQIDLQADPTIPGAKMIVGRRENLDRLVFLLPRHVPWLSFNVPRFVPYGLQWAGFAVNTIFYTVLLGVGLALARTARGRLRTRRGRCHACGYPAGVSPVCTECGAGKRDPDRIKRQPGAASERTIDGGASCRP